MTSTNNQSGTAAMEVKALNAASSKSLSASGSSKPPRRDCQLKCLASQPSAASLIPAIAASSRASPKSPREINQNTGQTRAMRIAVITLGR